VLLEVKDESQLRTREGRSILVAKWHAEGRGLTAGSLGRDASAPIATERDWNTRFGSQLS
jgi:hypothetical protein